MIVECPRCRARYRVESDVLDQDQTFKCSRCGHIFAYEAEGASTAIGPETPAPEPEAKPEAKKPAPRRDIESLSFQFQPSVASEPEAERTKVEAPRRADPPPVIHSREPEPELDDFTFDDDEPIVATPTRAPARRTPPIAQEPRFVRGEDDERVDDDEGGNAGRPYLVFLGGLVVIYALFSLNLLNHPAQAEKLLASVPVVGGVLAEDHLLQIRIQLQDVEGAYQQIKDDRVVFIVSGRAVNTSAEALKGVQIESTLYDGTGKPLETKNIYTGNAMSLKIVKDLSSKEVSLLQRLEPPKRFEIRPGESAGFSVVFLSPPTGAKEFTAKVVAAQSSAT